MDVILSLPILIGLIVVALAFDFLNGLHDAANSIATIVSTRVLRPQYAVFWPRSSILWLSACSGHRTGCHRVLGVGAFDAFRNRSRLPHSAIRFGLSLFAWPRRQRCAKDHGYHCGIREVLDRLRGIEPPKPEPDDPDKLN